MTTVSIVAVSLAALGAFVWSLIPIEEVTGRRPVGSASGHRAATRARLLASAVARTGRPAVEGVADGARSARRRAGTALERTARSLGARAVTAGRACGNGAVAAGRAFGNGAVAAGHLLRGQAGAVGLSLRERAVARDRVRPRAEHRPRSGARATPRPKPRFDLAHDLTGPPVAFREDYLPVAREADSAGSRALAALELILLVVLLGGLVAVAALGGAEILRHAFGRLGG